ncbi:MAG: lysylphosphatidylglycerol synthase transmembrane domain-containing protein [Acidobacteriota bacterium]
MPLSAPRRQITATGLVVAAAGTALFVWLVRSVGPGEIWNGFRQIGGGLGWILVLGGLRFAVRAEAWALCLEPPHVLRFADAFTAVVCGDALGNVTPFGPLVSEPTKIACVRGRVPVGAALTALAIENVIYTLSVAAMIAAGAITLIFSVQLPSQLREFSEVAVAGIVALFGLAGWMVWRRPDFISRLVPAGRLPHSRIEKLRAIEHEVLTFASRRRRVMLPLVLLELGFHALGVAEKHLTLWLILGGPPPLLTSFLVETVDRLITVAFKFVPFQVGFGEAGTGLMTELLGLGRGPGVTLSIVRKARMGIWSVVGTALLVRQGLTAKRVLEDAELRGSDDDG